MARAFSAALVCVFLLSSVFVAANASSGGSDEGSFPNRVFSVDNANPWPVKDVSYLTTVVPGTSGDWWVELTQIEGSYLLVQVYEGSSIHTKPLSSTDLKAVGDESKKTYMSAGGIYSVAFTCFGKKASATLQEHFESESSSQHAPIFIQSDSEFTAENGVIGGDGTSTSPYLISGWEIDVTNACSGGVEIVNTQSYFIIRDVTVHDGMGYYTLDGIHLYNNLHAVSVEGCVATANYVGIMVSACPGVLVSGNSVTGGNYVGIHVYESPGVVLQGNDVSGSVRFGMDLAKSEGLTVSGNTISGNGEYALVAVSCPGIEVLSNTVSTDVWSVVIRVCDNAIIEENSIIGGSLDVYDSLGVMVSRNTIVGTTSGSACLGIWKCPSAAVTDNSLTNSIWGLWYSGADYPVIKGNYVSGNWYGIGLCSDINIFPYVPIKGAIVSGNTVVGNEFIGINLLTACQDAIVSENIVSMNLGDGIVVESGINVLVEGNTVSDNVGSGVVIQFLMGMDNTVHGNKLSRNGVGVSLLYTTSPLIYGNDFVDNTVQAAQDPVTYGAQWDNGLPDGGNYWTDYTGVDDNSDGIGDTPYMIDSVNMDRYPIMMQILP
jgi:parallel beta-helix repeat protein